MRRLALHLALLLVGVGVAVYPLTFGATAPVTCRGVLMQPGATCGKAGSAATQSYEQRLRARRSARPVIVGVGLLIAAFGGGLAAGELRRRQTSKTQAG